MFIKVEAAPLEWIMVTSYGMMIITFLTAIAMKVPYQAESSQMTHKFDSAVRVMVARTVPSSCPPKIHFSYWRINQQNVRWFSGQWSVCSGYFMIPNTLETKTRQSDGFLTMQESHTPQFITVITEVSQLLLDSMYILTSLSVFALHFLAVFKVSLWLCFQKKIAGILIMNKLHETSWS